MHDLFKKIPLIILAFCLGALKEADAYTTESGKLGDTLYTWAKPTNWNGSWVIYNHGYRPKEQPLSATIDWVQEPFATFLKEGYLVAGSSYRRNGWVITDALADVKALEDFLLEQWGEPKSVLLVGESMGSAIAVRQLEAGNHAYSGALILGNGVESRDDKVEIEALVYRVDVPVLFLVNQSELENPAAYVEKAQKTSSPQPVLWTVLRDGHLKFSKAEQQKAVHGLLEWISSDIPLVEQRFVLDPARDSLATFSEDGKSARAQAVSIDVNYGNITTQFTATDLERLQIKPGDSFLLAVNGTKTVIPFVSTYSDVERGAWLAFLTGDGYVQIAINYGHAGNSLKVEVGAELFISAFD